MIELTDATGKIVVNPSIYGGSNYQLLRGMLPVPAGLLDRVSLYNRLIDLECRLRELEKK